MGIAFDLHDVKEFGYTCKRQKKKKKEVKKE